MPSFIPIQYVAEISLYDDAKKSINFLQTVHKKTFYYLEQLILKHKLHQHSLNIKEVNGRSMTYGCIHSLFSCIIVYISLKGGLAIFSKQIPLKGGKLVSFVTGATNVRSNWAEHNNLLHVNYLEPDGEPCRHIIGANQSLQLSWCEPGRKTCCASNQRSVIRARMSHQIPAMQMFILYSEMQTAPSHTYTNTLWHMSIEWRLSSSALCSQTWW